MANQLIPIDPVELLDILKTYPFLAGYSLAVYSFTTGVLANRGAPPVFCSPPGQSSVCGAGDKCPLEKAALEACSSAAPTVCRCHLSTLGFAIPLGKVADSPSCLVGWGVRAESINLSYLEKLAKERGIDPFGLLEQWGGLFAASTAEVKQAAEKTQELLSSIRGQNLHRNLLEKTVGKLTTVVDISAQIDTARSTEAVYALLTEALGICFDFPMIALALPDQEPQSFSIQGRWGLPEEIGRVPRDIFPVSRPEKTFTLGVKECPDLFRGTAANRVACFPIAAEELCSVLLVYNIDLHPRDALQVEILCDRVAVRLNRLRGGAQIATETLPDRLLSMLTSLADGGSGRNLYERILEGAVALHGASSGSVMLLDENRTTLKIEAALGLNSQLSGTIRIPVGEGIAGKVASTGKPILVNDIENDSRIGTANRPRFKTKSFLSVPLKTVGCTIGVLNLSDKADGGSFTDSDLQLLTVLATQASLVIERSELEEKTRRLERLTMADPVTGLYNRQSIIRRMDEEVNRSLRQGLMFSILLVELDYFALYAELCGPSSADTALQTTAALLTASARQMDAISRYGEETFCIILPGTGKKDAHIVAERIRTAIGREVFSCEENLPTGRLTATIGIAAYPVDGDSSSSLLTSAEKGLYQAKADGRNRIGVAPAVSALG